MTQYGVVLFFTTSAVIRAEKLLVKGGFVVKLIPTPRQFSSDCGIALRFDWENDTQIESHLAAARIEYNAVHLMD